ncbi:MAG: methylmalonyl Co-A mutase-associated GTPase MeaB [Chloroflexota bacterium]
MSRNQASSPKQTAVQIQQGNKRALARLITQIENKEAVAQSVLSELYPNSGQAHLIGVTGSPGTGKSTLVTSLAQVYRQQGQTVAIVAVDPTSPFSGGALLGDRVRMMQLAGDSGIFIRSMANRGHLGGLAQTTNDVVKALDGAGYEIILIETVGAGQSEIEIVQAAHSIIVVEAPGLGDGVQAIKAGILEIADIYVVNKADRPEANKTVSALRNMLDLGHPPPTHYQHHGLLLANSEAEMSSSEADSATTDVSTWQHPIIKTIAIKGDGVSDLVTAISDHGKFLHESNLLKTRNHHRLIAEIETRLQGKLIDHYLKRLPQPDLVNIRNQVLAGHLTPYAAVEIILSMLSRE